jgi:competence protein ComEA
MKNLRKSLLVLLFAVALPVAAYAGPVDINSADAATISAELKGVGMSKAEAIVAYRQSHGPFKSYEDLTLVKGIGARTVEINRANIQLKSPDKKSK